MRFRISGTTRSYQPRAAGERNSGVDASSGGNCGCSRVGLPDNFRSLIGVLGLGIYVTPEIVTLLRNHWESLPFVRMLPAVADRRGRKDFYHPPVQHFQCPTPKGVAFHG
jgi:hypothetical protein